MNTHERLLEKIKLIELIEELVNDFDPGAGIRVAVWSGSGISPCCQCGTFGEGLESSPQVDVRLESQGITVLMAMLQDQRGSLDLWLKATKRDIAQATEAVNAAEAFITLKK